MKEEDKFANEREKGKQPTRQKPNDTIRFFICSDSIYNLRISYRIFISDTIKIEDKRLKFKCFKLYDEI